jgi:DNA-binding response OmpR family regulator
LVDDERSTADMYRIGLEARGFTVAVYPDGPPFFEALEGSLPDFVLLDWNLPTLNGGDVLERLRRDERTRHLPVAILSNSPRRHYADVMLSRLGALAWLEKVSTTPAQLAETVARLFEEATHDPA